MDRKHTFEGTQHTRRHLKLSDRNRCNTLPSLSPLLLVHVCVYVYRLAVATVCGTSNAAYHASCGIKTMHFCFLSAEGADNESSQLYEQLYFSSFHHPANSPGLCLNSLFFRFIYSELIHEALRLSLAVRLLHGCPPPVGLGTGWSVGQTQVCVTVML